MILLAKSMKYFGNISEEKEDVLLTKKTKMEVELCYVRGEAGLKQQVRNVSKLGVIASCSTSKWKENPANNLFIIAIALLWAFN